MPAFTFRSFLYASAIGVSIVLFSACAAIGINISHKTPKKPKPYPHFTECDSLHGNLSAFRKCYDVTFYDLDIRFDIKNKSISGKVVFYYNATTDFDTLQIDLYKQLQIDSIIANGRQLSYYRKCNAIFVVMNESAKANSSNSFTVYYKGKPQQAKRPPWEGGFVWKKDKQKNPWVGVACEVDGASLWWPVKDHLSDEPDSARMRFTVPEGLKCISNGILEDSTTLNGLSSFTWKVHYPINTYNISFYIGKFEHFSISNASKFEPFGLDFYVLPENIDKAKEHFLQVPEIVHFYESTFGQYPWTKDGYKLIESPFAGMEHQSAIAYGEGYKNFYNYAFDHIILHESAHEWWGNSVTAPDYAEVWIHEGFATYAEALYVEHLYGYDTYLNYLRFYAMLIKNQRPIVGPHNVNFWEYKDTDVYMKGALLLHTLRNTMRNDSLFFDLIKEFYHKFQYKTAVSKDFIDLVNEKTQNDYTAFFNQYLYSRTCPELEWEFFFNKEKNRNEIYYRWSNTVEGFSIPIKVKVGDRTFVLKPTRKLQISGLPEGNTIIVNSDGSYIASKRTDIFK